MTLPYINISLNEMYTILSAVSFGPSAWWMTSTEFRVSTFEKSWPLVLLFLSCINAWLDHRIRDSQGFWELLLLYVQISGRDSGSICSQYSGKYLIPTHILSFLNFSKMLSKMSPSDQLVIFIHTQTCAASFTNPSLDGSPNFGAGQPQPSHAGFGYIQRSFRTNWAWHQGILILCPPNMEHLAAGSEAFLHDATLNLFKHHWKLVLIFSVVTILMYFHLILLLKCFIYCNYCCVVKRPCVPVTCICES